jgi:ribonucleotide reductase alpha subunit
MQQFKPTKTRILKTETFLNDGTHICKYEAQIYNKLNMSFLKWFIIILIPLTWGYFITFFYDREWYKSLGVFDLLQDAQNKIDETIEQEKKDWLKQENYTTKQYIKYP